MIPGTCGYRSQWDVLRGAFYLLAESDIIIANESATFFDPHVTYGMPAVYEPMKNGSTQLPLGEILRLTLLGNYERMTAETAKQIGLISEVLEDDALIEKALWLAESIAAQPPIAVQASLRASGAANDLGRLDAMALAPSLLTTGMSKSSLKEGQKVLRAVKEFTIGIVNLTRLGSSSFCQ